MLLGTSNATCWKIGYGIKLQVYYSYRLDAHQNRVNIEIIDIVVPNVPIETKILTY